MSPLWEYESANGGAGVESHRNRRPLEVGARLRLTPGGQILTVIRVNTCAAYLGRSWKEMVTKTDRKTGEEKTFEVTRQDVVAVSPYAFVYHVEEEEDEEEEEGS